MELKASENVWRPKPGVINTDMIKQAVSRMIQEEVPGVQFDEEEGYEFHEITQLYLEHMEILRIDHLWIMPALTVLKLTGNLISKIENLESLVNLVDLNLSFNRIQVIENLDKLTKLRHLSFFSNLITKIENLSHLKELKIFTIGNNQIEDKDGILHLRKMNLFSLNMADNPCAKGQGFRDYVAAFMPHLEYYEYVKISGEERERGRSRYLMDLEALERDEASDEKDKEVDRLQTEKDDLYTRAFVEDLDGNQLYEAMMEADSNSQALLLIGEEVGDSFHKFKESVGTATKEIFSLGLEQLKLREREVELYHEGVQQATVKGKEKQRNILEMFMENKSGLVLDLVGLWDETSEETLRTSVDEAMDKANVICLKVKRELLTLEINLSEQLKEIFSLFERSVGDMINSFIEASQGFFTTMREHETVLAEHLSDQASRFLTQLSVRGEELTSLPMPLRPVMVDKESLNTALASSHDVYLQTIDSREDRLMSRARLWLQKLCHELELEETTRFRDRINEIVNFLELQANDFKQYNVPVDDDVFMFGDVN